jgi:tRNA pseudouridine38-40 synthase
VGGRTDKGVHATGQVISFWSHTDYPSEFILKILSESPSDIVVRHVQVVPRSFHARYSAAGRRYVYFHPLSTASIELMNIMLCNIVGRRCFSAFARNTPAGKSTVRTLWDARVRLALYHEQPMLRFDFGSDGFLRRQVRVMVASVIREASKNAPEECLLDFCLSGDRTRTASPAAPEGLFLSKILYGPC